MSDITNVQEHKLPQPANAAGVTAARADLHRPGDHGHHHHHKDKAAPDLVRCEATASAMPGAELGEAARTADRAYRPARPVDRAWPFNPEDTSPLAWWRTLPPDRLRDAQTLLLNTTLDRIGVMRGGDILIAALRGEVAAAVAVALAMMPIEGVTLEIDLAMTAVLRGALAGDGPAALLLAHVLGRADIGHPFATELSASWLTPQRRHSDQRSFPRQEARRLAAMRERDELPAASVGGEA